jgi:prepilin-type N-terminal cleavage/methylation domain-containing protein
MKKSTQGFTLLEVMIALSITVGAAVLIVTAWGGNYARVRKGTLNTNIAQLLTRKMSEMESKYRNKQLTEIKDEEGDFGEDYANYRWSFKVQPFEMPDLAPLLQAKDNKGTDQMLLTVMSKMREALGKAIVEATVTITVDVAGKVITHSVTTYFVDYETEPNIGLGG